MSRTKVFVSYAHTDEDWLKRFSQHVAVLERRGLVELWSDTRIPAGADWQREIDNSLTAAKVAVLLITPGFLASAFIWNSEMPRIFAHAEQGMAMLPLLVRPCAWRLAEGLARWNPRPPNGRFLSLGSESEIDLELMNFTYELGAHVDASPAAMAASDLLLGTTGEPEAGLAGVWVGDYNGTRPVRLVIRDLRGEVFGGRMEYRNEGTVTNVEGVIHERWSPNDTTWAQIGGTEREGRGKAVSFRETGYEGRNGSHISFDGEYRVFLQGDRLTGAWFSGTRLVGSLQLERSTS